MFNSWSVFCFAVSVLFLFLVIFLRRFRRISPSVLLLLRPSIQKETKVQAEILLSNKGSKFEPYLCDFMVKWSFNPFLESTDEKTLHRQVFQLVKVIADEALAGKDLVRVRNTQAQLMSFLREKSNSILNPHIQIAEISLLATYAPMN